MPSDTKPTPIAAVSYLNTLPLIAGLDQLDQIELIRAVPSAIHSLVATNQALLGLASVIDYARSDVPMTLVPASAIGCRGETLTVRLFSTRPPSQITTLHADTDSHTSITLARIILAESFGVTPEIAPFNAPEQTPGPDDSDDQWPQALLLIGDKVVTASPPAVRYPHQLDLGKAWHDLTGLPFVYATWMCRSDALDDPASAARITTAAALLDRQLRRNLTRLDRLVSDHAPSMNWPADLARQYLGSLLQYSVAKPEQDAIQLFLDKAAALNAAPRTTPTYFSPSRGQTAPA